MDKIVMVDLQKQYQKIKVEVDAAMQEVLNTTAFIQGPQVQQFADALGKYNDVEFVIPCANGTDALQIAMMALDCKPGDEIILPVHTYVATAEVIALLGLIPVFTEVNADTFNIDVKQIESKITSKTKAIVPVHLYGQCADMEPLLAIADKHNLYVIEDTAQALGAVYTFNNGKKMRAGTMGTIGTTSFFPSKNLGCYGDGGALFTRDKDLAEKIKMMANHGQRIKYHHDVIGVNSRLDTLQAAILNVKLKYLDQYEAARNKVAAYYDNALASINGIITPVRSNNSSHVFHQYTLKVRGNKRDALKRYLEDKGIPTMIYYPVPLHLQKAYVREGFGEGSFPLTESLSREVISLPIHTEMIEEHQAYIVSCIKDFFNN
ncbi:DegT/DnrJ/EryC1/StrS family aminotransferase [Chryseotalea sanaruensis]|uniref:DegT/DnrJ/EryC1/StrS family aminotransferase n=1 Tax=Chryseotalea sanaruensis TaxID=2482724 RepID=A0A401UC51_9BACT|nr:DegT/DnrJ/EryC1/StrS family aminotransferase [Chryseotalea sanaruensis]GCC52457.1 DegT/DnrJ/EryC1/StrS family aminotransferase [Chryseotalea sanaruensis]